MKIYYKGVFTIQEQIEILATLKNKTKGKWVVDRHPKTQTPRIRGEA